MGLFVKSTKEVCTSNEKWIHLKQQSRGYAPALKSVSLFTTAAAAAAYNLFPPATAAAAENTAPAATLAAAEFGEDQQPDDGITADTAATLIIVKDEQKEQDPYNIVVA